MNTNLFATLVITLATNVVEVPTVWERYEQAPCPDGRLGCLVNHWKGVGEPTAKTQTATATRTHTFLVPYAGTTQKWEYVETLWSKSTNLVRMSTWTEAPPTNWVHVLPTNSMTLFNLDSHFEIYK